MLKIKLSLFEHLEHLGISKNGVKIFNNNLCGLCTAIFAAFAFKNF
jgi:hypothetical protein